MRDYKQEIKEMGCSGDFEKERLEEREDGGCLKCYLFDYCAGVFKEAERAEWDAKSPEEKAQHEAMIKGLRKLY